MKKQLKFFFASSILSVLTCFSMENSLKSEFKVPIFEDIQLVEKMIINNPEYKIKSQEEISDLQLNPTELYNIAQECRNYAPNFSLLLIDILANQENLESQAIVNQYWNKENEEESSDEDDWEEGVEVTEFNDTQNFGYPGDRKAWRKKK